MPFGDESRPRLLLAMAEVEKAVATAIETCQRLKLPAGQTAKLLAAAARGAAQGGQAWTEAPEAAAANGSFHELECLLVAAGKALGLAKVSIT